MTIAAAVMVAVIPGMTPVGEPPILGIAAFALFMALINASIKPIVHLASLPFAILSLGLVTLIINWLFMRLASWLAVSLFGVGVFVHGFWWSVLGSLVRSILDPLTSDFGVPAEWTTIVIGLMILVFVVLQRAVMAVGGDKK